MYERLVGGDLVAVGGRCTLTPPLLGSLRLSGYNRLANSIPPRCPHTWPGGKRNRRYRRCRQWRRRGARIEGLPRTSAARGATGCQAVDRLTGPLACAGVGCLPNSGRTRAGSLRSGLPLRRDGSDARSWLRQLSVASLGKARQRRRGEQVALRTLA
jgi:hypothetical protein